jgi:chemotaxis signal transduction protein
MSDPGRPSDSDETRALHARGDASADLSLERMRSLLDRPLADEDLRANTAIYAERADARAARMRSVLVFVIGEERFGIEAEESHRVVPLSTVRRVPHRTNEVFAGLANIGGELTVVAHAGAALGVPPGPVQTHFIVIGASGSRWAFAADRVEGVRRIDATATLPPPATVRHAADGCTKYLAELAPVAGGVSTLVGVLDAGRLSALLARSLA